MNPLPCFFPDVCSKLLCFTFRIVTIILRIRLQPVAPFFAFWRVMFLSSNLSDRDKGFTRKKKKKIDNRTIANFPSCCELWHCRRPGLNHWLPLTRPLCDRDVFSVSWVYPYDVDIRSATSERRPGRRVVLLRWVVGNEACLFSAKSVSARSICGWTRCGPKPLPFPSPPPQPECTGRCSLGSITLCTTNHGCVPTCLNMHFLHWPLRGFDDLRQTASAVCRPPLQAH